MSPQKKTFPEPDIYADGYALPPDIGGETIRETLNPSTYPPLTNRSTYLHHRATTPSIHTSSPKAWNPTIDHASRLYHEVALYTSYTSRGATLPPMSEYQESELTPQQADALFDEMERRGVLDALWGRHKGQGRGAEPSRRQMWDLMRDEGWSFGARYAAIEDEDKGAWTRTVWVPSEGREGRRWPWWVGRRSW